MPDNGSIDTENFMTQSHSSPIHGAIEFRNVPDVLATPGTPEQEITEAVGTIEDDPMENVEDQLPEDNIEADEQVILPTETFKSQQQKHATFWKRLEDLEDMATLVEELPQLGEEFCEENNKNVMNDNLPFIDAPKTTAAEKHWVIPEISVFEAVEETSKQSFVSDGIVLKNDEDNNFLNPNNISPIFKHRPSDDSLQKIEEEYDDFPDDSILEMGKRKRCEDDSFDNISMLSTDSLVYGSAKKPKLTRTGSIKTLRRSISMAIKTPMSNILRSRRSSVDPNASISSIASSFNESFNESIRKPVKETFLKIKNKITKSSKKDIGTPKSAKTKANISSNFDSLKKVCKMRTLTKTPEKSEDNTCIGFKTPLAPPPQSSSSSSRHTFLRSHIQQTTQNTSICTTTNTVTKTSTTVIQSKEVVDLGGSGIDVADFTSGTKVSCTATCSLDLNALPIAETQKMPVLSFSFLSYFLVISDMFRKFCNIFVYVIVLLRILL